MVARKCDVETVQRRESGVAEADAKAAGLVVIGSLVAVSFFIVDFDGIENQVRLFRGNRLDEMLITVIVLFGNGEFYLGTYFLGRYANALGIARRDVESDDLTVGRQASV